MIDTLDKLGDRMINLHLPNILINCFLNNGLSEYAMVISGKLSGASPSILILNGYILILLINSLLILSLSNPGMKI